MIEFLALVVIGVIALTFLGSACKGGARAIERRDRRVQTERAIEDAMERLTRR